VGGPVFIPKIFDGRNRTFFFGSYQGGRRVIGSNGLAQVPTAAERTGDFSAWPTTLFDPLSGVLTPGQALPIARTAFPGNPIPSSRFAPQSAALIKYWPSPNQACATPCNNDSASTNTPVRMDQYTIRADHNFSAKAATPCGLPDRKTRISRYSRASAFWTATRFSSAPRPTI
jgi:hypothetical protein